MTKETLLLAACIILSAATNIMTAKEKPLSPDGTYLFAERDTCELYLDIYNPARKSKTKIDGKKKPTIVFMFGGVLSVLIY